ncbi:MAG: four helix bundle protein [Selenomonadaceae bacterium]|nr:four helix bundle protein [Selenomonadaceae bacterium]
MTLRSYKEFTVWQKSIDLAVEIYRLVRLLPKTETYALSDQMRRAAISIPSNIAEGQGRNSTREFIKFLAIARGSQSELETQLQLCVRIGYVDESEISVSVGLCNEVGKMLNVLIRKLTQTLAKN